MGFGVSLPAARREPQRYVSIPRALIEKTVVQSRWSRQAGTNCHKVMFRLIAGLLPVLLAVPALADDRQYPRYTTDELGNASAHRHDRIIPVFGEKKPVQCGTLKKSCTITFTADRMKVDGSTGITPSQVISVTLDSNGQWNPALYMIFSTSAGEKHMAVFYARHASDLSHLANTILAFASGRFQDQKDQVPLPPAD